MRSLVQWRSGLRLPPALLALSAPLLGCGAATPLTAFTPTSLPRLSNVRSLSTPGTAWSGWRSLGGYLTRPQPRRPGLPGSCRCVCWGASARFGVGMTRGAPEEAGIRWGELCRSL